MGITLYTAATPNGQKVSIALEELGLEYEVKALNLGAKEQKADACLAINPNGRIPAIVDHDNNDLAVFESGACLLYLADRYGKGKLIPEDDQGKYTVVGWVMWQMSGQGPMQGQVPFFTNSFQPKQPKTIERFFTETSRLYSVLETQLSNNPYVAGETYSVADIACFGWAFVTPMSGINLLDYPHVNTWLQGMRARPAVIKGMDLPAKAFYRERLDAALANPAKYNELIAEIRAKQLLTE